MGWEWFRKGWEGFGGRDWRGLRRGGGDMEVRAGARMYTIARAFGSQFGGGSEYKGYHMRVSYSKVFGTLRRTGNTHSYIEPTQCHMSYDLGLSCSQTIAALSTPRDMS